MQNLLTCSNRMGRCRALVVLSAAITTSAASVLVAGAQHEPDSATSSLAIERPEARAKTRLQVSSQDFPSDGTIPERFSDYRENASPRLRWTGAPAATRSFVLLVEDPDAPAPKPFIHWVLYNLSPQTTELPSDAPRGLRLTAVIKGGVQGRNSNGSLGYYGPHPPRLDGPHRYHFQVFALDAMLKLEPMASRNAVLQAMSGHVLASGEVVGLFKAPQIGK